MTAFDSSSVHALLTTEQMGRADAATIEAGTPGETLMENAGRAVAEAARAAGGDGRAVVLAGPGNNGGDGFVAARHLADAGCEVTVALLGARESLKGDAARMAARWPGEVAPLVPAVLANADLVVDALFGAGLSRPVEGGVAETVEAANATRALRVAVDVPTGIHGDDGQVKGTAFDAHLTVTFFRKKPGHLLAPGRFFCGNVAVYDIGIAPWVLESIAPESFENAPALWAADWPIIEPGAHKYARGHALVVSGRPPALGATRMTAMAALRAGAGLVTLAVAEEGYAIQAGALTEVMVAPLAGHGDLVELLADSRRSVVAIGPGAGVGRETRKAVLAGLEAGKRVVLDADALTAFAEKPDTLFGAIAAAVRSGGVAPAVMTPHAGEFTRLFGPPDDPDKLAATRAAAVRSGAVVLHKGPDTVIAAPGGTAIIDASGPPHLATAGSGDVLTGIVAGCLSQAMPALPAAAAAARLHGAAARRHGRGMIAGDLIDSLPEALAELDAELAT